MKSIFVKEINSFFSSIVGYVAILVFLSSCGLFLWVLPEYNILGYGYAVMDRFFEVAPWLMLFLVPAVTMKSLSDEFKSGTIEWLASQPVSPLEIILGKYLAIIALLLFSIFPTLVYVYTISNLSFADVGLDTGAIIGSYIGLLFLASSFAAIGLCSSSITSNQVVSFLIALVANFLFYTGFERLSRLPDFTQGFDYYISMIGLEFHYNSMSRGYIDTRDVIYFLSVSIIFIALTQFSLDSRTREVSRQG